LIGVVNGLFYGQFSPGLTGGHKHHCSPLPSERNDGKILYHQAHENKHGNQGQTMAIEFQLSGWIEREGRRLSRQEIAAGLSEGINFLGACGGEFLLEWNGCAARDHIGIIPGDILPGTCVCEGSVIGEINPPIHVQSLDKAICEAIRLRSDEGVVSFSGGLDSALIAALAGRPCVTVGTPDSHDVRRAESVARVLGVQLETVLCTPRMVEDALREVVRIIPRTTPLDASIATTLFFVAEWASLQGYPCIIAGQGADELFGGYARYLHSASLSSELEADVLGLSAQIARDQAVAMARGIWFSLPYLDLRVMRAARLIPAREKVREGVRKYPLRVAASRYLPEEIAWYEKKAMQYGSGIWKVIQRLARKNGYKNSVQRYITSIKEKEDDHRA
jgi:asparagine synthase (glutamine-hydrolysing)